MAREPHDITKPGPAGMWFDPSVLTAEGLEADRAARAALETYCDICGSANAGNGFGNFSHSRGVIACSDADCLREARDRAAAAKAAPKAPAAGRDLFSPLMAAE